VDVIEKAEEILSKTNLPNRRRQIPAGSADDPDVDLNLLCSFSPGKAAFFQNLRKFLLQAG